MPAAETSYPCLLAWARLLHVFFAGMIMLYQIVGMWCYTAVASHACRRCDRLRHPRARGRSDDLHGVRPWHDPALLVVHLLVRESLLARLQRVLSILFVSMAGFFGLIYIQVCCQLLGICQVSRRLSPVVGSSACSAPQFQRRGEEYWCVGAGWKCGDGHAVMGSSVPCVWWCTLCAVCGCRG